MLAIAVALPVRGQVVHRVLALGLTVALPFVQSLRRLVLPFSFLSSRSGMCLEGRGALFKLAPVGSVHQDIVVQDLADYRREVDELPRGPHGTATKMHFFYGHGWAITQLICCLENGVSPFPLGLLASPST